MVMYDTNMADWARRYAADIVSSEDHDARKSEYIIVERWRLTASIEAAMLEAFDLGIEHARNEFGAEDERRGYEQGRRDERNRRP